MERRCTSLHRLCELCPLSHFDKCSYTITTSMQPLLNVEYRKSCQHYFPKIEPIKAVRFKQPVNKPQCYGPWTNLMYRPIIQGALKYRGVYKLVPVDPPPSNPVLCRPAPDRPTDSTGMVVYRRWPTFLHHYV